MRAVVQRVGSASVTVDGRVVGAIEAGLCVLLGVAAGDGPDEADWLARRVARLRIFPNDEGRFDRSVVDVGGAALVVSQFTLIADTARGNRPSFARAAQPDVAEPLYERFRAVLEQEGVPTAAGEFGAHMAVSLVNDGPVTIVLDTRAAGG
ncbi:MAG: D-aminoacyl-tRNA deacylase [Thermoleophilia bacterium]